MNIYIFSYFIGLKMQNIRNIPYIPGLVEF